VRGEAEYFSDIPDMKLPAEMMKLAQHIITTKSENFDPSMLQDHYRNALVRILRKKQATTRPAHPPPVKPAAENVVNLMDALRCSIAAEKRPAAKSASRRSTAAKRAVRRPQSLNKKRQRKTIELCDRAMNRTWWSNVSRADILVC
jgi:non-homologous end joining protein Ku